MKRFVILVEKYLIRIVILSAVALVVVQGMMTRDDYRFYLSVGERMEGQKYEQVLGKDGESLSSNSQEIAASQAQTQSPDAVLTISLDKFSSLPRAFVLVNHRKASDFSEKQVRLELMAGDVVEIDATYYNFPVAFKVTDTSANISSPQKNQTFQTNQGIVMLGKVVVK